MNGIYANNRQFGSCKLSEKEKAKRQRFPIAGSDNFWIDKKGRVFHLDESDGCKHWTVSEVVETHTEYPYVDISFDGTFRKVYVHRLVAETFIPNPKNLPVVMHKNNLKTDYDVENLKWGTQSENITSAYTDGLFKTTPNIEKIKEACECLSEKTSMQKTAEITGLPYTTVCKIKHRQRWASISKNYHW